MYFANDHHTMNVQDANNVTAIRILKSRKSSMGKNNFVVITFPIFICNCLFIYVY